MTAENFTGQVLWAVPGGALFGALAARGWLSPTTASSPLPPSALAGGRLIAPAEVVVRAGRTVTVTVQVHHGPGGAPWPSVDALHSGSGRFGVRLTVEGRGPPGLTTSGDASACVGSASVSLACRRLELPETLLPDQMATVPLTIIAAPGVRPGRYSVRLGLVQEGVGAFTTSATVTVVVTP